MMKRVVIIGSGGAGKSTLARRLAEATGLEVVHLDALYWRAGWVETPKDEWARVVEGLVGRESWIMDGNYGGTMEKRLAAADTIIFMDVSRWVCLWRVLKRVALYREGSRPDMAAGCPERVSWQFLRYVWNYPRDRRPGVEERLRRYGATRRVVRLKTGADIENFLAGLGPPGGAPE